MASPVTVSGPLRSTVALPRLERLARSPARGLARLLVLGDLLEDRERLLGARGREREERGLLHRGLGVGGERGQRRPARVAAIPRERFGAGAAEGRGCRRVERGG